EPGALPENDLTLGQALADVATIGILQERAIRRAEIVNEQLQTALTSRVTIEQAKGVLSEHFEENVDEAFDRLRHYARSRNAKLAEVAGRDVRRELDLAEFTPPRHPSKRRGTAASRPPGTGDRAAGTAQRWALVFWKAAIRQSSSSRTSTNDTTDERSAGSSAWPGGRVPPVASTWATSPPPRYRTGTAIVGGSIRKPFNGP